MSFSTPQITGKMVGKEKYFFIAPDHLYVYKQITNPSLPRSINDDDDMSR